MFSGKTETLLRQVIRSELAGRKVQVFKPLLDTRWGKTNSIASHSGGEHPAIPIPAQVPEDILKHLQEGTQIVAIDEVQFFDPNIIPVVQILTQQRNIEVLVAGLPQDFRGQPFGSMPYLLILADYIDKLTAICTENVNGEICGQNATRTQRLINDQPALYNSPIVLIGGEEAYAARCPTHHQVPGKPLPEIQPHSK